MFMVSLIPQLYLNMGTDLTLGKQMTEKTEKTEKTLFIKGFKLDCKKIEEYVEVSK